MAFIFMQSLGYPFEVFGESGLKLFVEIVDFIFSCDILGCHVLVGQVLLGGDHLLLMIVRGHLQLRIQVSHRHFRVKPFIRRFFVVSGVVLNLRSSC